MRMEADEIMEGLKQKLRNLLERLGLLPAEGVHYIGGSDTLPPPLTKEREKELLGRVEEECARQELIEHNLRLVVYIARRFETRGSASRTSSPSGPLASSRRWGRTGPTRTSSWRRTPPGVLKMRF